MVLEHVVVLVGGVGGAKLAYGLAQILPANQLTVIVNTGDDFWHYGLKICPDIDTIMYTLSGRVDRRNGWGLANDTTQMLSALQLYGENTWFRLGDLDLATHILRTHRLAQGETLTQVMAHLCKASGILHPILPVTNAEVPTLIDTDAGELAFQTYFVRERWQPVIKQIRYVGAQAAQPSAEVQHALASASAIIIAPSNPWLSIAPILAVGNMHDLLRARTDIPRVAVTPIISGEAIKGPTAKIMAELGITPSMESVMAFYTDLINGFVYDLRDSEPASNPAVRTAAMQTLMRSDHDKIQLAQSLLHWLESWGD